MIKESSKGGPTSPSEEWSVGRGTVTRPNLKVEGYISTTPE